MSELSVVEDSIKYCIKKNGFPEKSVRLPFKAIHESCKNHDTTLKEVLANLIKQKIVGTIQGNFIEFRFGDKPQQKPTASGNADDSSNINPSDIENLKEMARSYMSKMSPEQIKELEKTISNMDEEERKNILNNFSQQFFKNKL